MILGLDISTSVIGVCVLEEKSLVKVDFINLEKSKNIFEKSEKFKSYLVELKKQFDITKIGVEENLQAFRPGLSSAKTIVTLARFNGICSYISQEIFRKEPVFVNVNSARKALGVKIDRKSSKNTKEQILEFVSALEPGIEWPTKVLKGGPRRGSVVLQKECYDMADAYVIAHDLAKRE
tara:strand:- start:1 stop:537 length:537 start_codon:yes stop_codon:yes gene_type:complete